MMSRGSDGVVRLSVKPTLVNRKNRCSRSVYLEGTFLCIRACTNRIYESSLNEIVQLHCVGATVSFLRIWELPCSYVTRDGGACFTR